VDVFSAALLFPRGRTSGMELFSGTSRRRFSCSVPPHVSFTPCKFVLAWMFLFSCFFSHTLAALSFCGLTLFFLSALTLPTFVFFAPVHSVSSSLSCRAVLTWEKAVKNFLAMATVSGPFCAGTFRSKVFLAVFFRHLGSVGGTGFEC